MPSSALVICVDYLFQPLNFNVSSPIPNKGRGQLTVARMIQSLVNLGFDPKNITVLADYNGSPYPHPTRANILGALRGLLTSSVANTDKTFVYVSGEAVQVQGSMYPYALRNALSERTTYALVPSDYYESPVTYGGQVPASMRLVYDFEIRHAMRQCVAFLPYGRKFDVMLDVPYPHEFAQEAFQYELKWTPLIPTVNTAYFREFESSRTLSSPWPSESSAWPLPLGRQYRYVFTDAFAGADSVIPIIEYNGSKITPLALAFTRFCIEDAPRYMATINDNSLIAASQRGALPVLVDGNRAATMWHGSFVDTWVQFSKYINSTITVRASSQLADAVYTTERGNFPVFKLVTGREMWFANLMRWAETFRSLWDDFWFALGYK